MTDPGDRWREVARLGSGEDYARRYAERFAQLAASGEDTHGEAAFVAALLGPGATVLDAGCGTGRVASRLADLGFDVVGADVDEAMVTVARELRPELTWVVADLGTLDLGASRFDAVVLAGNVVPFIEPPELPAVAQRLGHHLHPDGVLVSGFGLDRRHLPSGAPVVPLEAWDDALTTAGLVLRARHGGWDGTPYAHDGYAVSVHELGRSGRAGVGTVGSVP